MPENSIDVQYLKIATAVVLLVFQPLLSFSYYFFRRKLEKVEDERRLEALGVVEKYAAEAKSGHEFGIHLVLASLFLTLIVALGLTVLFFVDDGAFQALPTAAFGFPRAGSRVVIGMAFLGAYLWGLQYLIRRYFMNDLIPGVYYRIGLRIFLAAALALLISNAFMALSGDDGADGKMEAAWPAIAFLIGMFPQSGLKWLTEKIPLFSAQTHATARQLPLEMIEGVSIYDRMRLEELGIDNCHDLADEDFVPLFMRTPYSARKLINWILQAKLCVSAGDGVKALREHNIFRITDLATITDKDAEDLAAQTVLTKDGLMRAKKALESDAEIQRLNTAVLELGKYTRLPSDRP